MATVTVKNAVAVSTSGRNVLITNIGPDQWLVYKDGDPTVSYQVQGFDAAVASTDQFAAALDAIDNAATAPTSALDTFITTQQTTFANAQQVTSPPITQPPPSA